MCDFSAIDAERSAQIDNVDAGLLALCSMSDLKYIKLIADLSSTRKGNHE